MTSFSLVLKAEKNVIYLLLGRRTIKKLIRRAVGTNGAELVDQCYKLAGITLGKRPAKKFIQSLLNVISEISVLTMHGKLKEPQLQDIRRCICNLAAEFKKIHNAISEVENVCIRSEPILQESKKEFKTAVRQTEQDLIRLLHPYCQLSTLKRLRCISKTLCDPEIANVCFQKSESDVSALIEEIIKTSEKITQDQIEKFRSRSQSQSRTRSRRR